MSILDMWNYNVANVSEDGLLLGKKLIPWNDINSMSVVSEGRMYYVATLNKKYYLVKDPIMTTEKFQNHVIQKSGLELYAEAKPTLMKRWVRPGTKYIYANYEDKLADGFYGLNTKYSKTRQIIVIILFAVCLISILYGYFNLN